METVSWRRAAVAGAATVAVMAGVVFAVRADGYSAVDATVPRATRWFVDQATGRAVLADGFSGRPLARLELDDQTAAMSVVQSASGVALVDRSAATVRSVDTAQLRVGPPQSVTIVSAPDAVVGVGQAGVVAVDTATARGVVLPPDGAAVPFDVGDAGGGDLTRVAPDGAVVTLAGGALTRVTSSSRDVLATGLAGAQFTLVGTTPLVLDEDRGRVRFGDGVWVDVPDDVPITEIVLQQPGPVADCGWVAGNDLLWCVDENGISERVVIAGLDVDGADLLSIAGNAGALVRRDTSTIVRLDWRAGLALDGPDDTTASVPAGSQLAMSASVDLIWIDQIDGPFVWSVHPWGINVIRKDDASSPLLGESGQVIAQGEGSGSSVESGSEIALVPERPDPDDNGIDDPPIAIDDPVTARAGAAVPIAVTVNDYDPDGEAVAVVEVGDANHGAVTITDASTVSYQPASGYIGLDEFEYTIADGNGTPASAMVTIELLPFDTVNRAPVGSDDVTETGPGTPVLIDVLLNDIDPERDPLRIDTFTSPATGGVVTEALSVSGLPALRFAPDIGFSGTATFTYRPIDALGAAGESVTVNVEVAQASDANREPIVQPDAIRLRRDVSARVAVVANDRDPDGDRMAIDVVRPLPPGIEVTVDGIDLTVVARAGAAQFSSFQYAVDDGHRHVVRGWVLVVLISDTEPNRPPVANADTATGVAGAQRLIDVLANDSDPDGDTLILQSTSQPDTGPGAGAVRVVGDQIEYTAGQLAADDDPLFDQFEYEISDGKGHTATGRVTVRVLPEAVGAPPFAGDDAATTDVDVAVTIAVLRNDGDPSGEPPTIAGNPGCAGGGAAVVTPDSRVTFTPPPGRTGTFTCTYEVSNSQGLTASATIVINVVPPSIVNVAPIVGEQEVVVETSAEVVIDLLASATDPDGPATGLRVVSSTAPVIGAAERDGRLLTFEAGSVPGVASVDYQVADAAGGVTTGRLVIRIVEPQPVAPIAGDDRRTVTAPSGSVTIEVLGNDVDPDGIASDLTVESVTVVSGDGTATNTSSTVVLTPAATFVGDLVATYTIVDRDGMTDAAEVRLTVLAAPNRPPIAGDDQAEVAAGQSVSVAIALNDFDPDGDQLTYSLVSTPTSELGTATLEGASLVFDANVRAAGDVTVDYAISDGQLSTQATVVIRVMACAAAPPQAPNVFLQTGYQQPIAIDLSAYARNGSIVEVGAPLGTSPATYTPPAGENGNVSFTYVVRNACEVDAVGRVTIDVNQDPVGTALVTQIGRTQPVTIPVSALASDAEPLTIVALEGAPAWVTLFDESRAIAINPVGQSGRVDLTAVIGDPGGLLARVPVTIDLVNLAPIANPDVVRADSNEITFQPLANDLDPDGDPISLQSVPDSVTFTNGHVAPVERLPDDSLRIDVRKAEGSATLTYNVVDQLGLVSVDTTVTVTVNSSPVTSDVDVTVPAGGSVSVGVSVTDVDGDLLTLVIDDDPAPLAITIDGLVLTITAPLDEVGTELTLGYTVSDPFGGSASATLTITVGQPPATTPPTAVI